jgi:hypothetical protein
MAIADTARLAERIHPPLLEVDLAVALRAAARERRDPGHRRRPSRRLPAARRVDGLPLCLEALDGAEGVEARGSPKCGTRPGGSTSTSSSARARKTPELGCLVDRVRRLGGSMMISSSPGRALASAASLPVPRWTLPRALGEVEDDRLDALVDRCLPR